MPKRKKSHTSADDTFEEVESSRKKRRVEPDSVSDICQELYDVIRNHKTHDGRLACETFIRNPKRRTAADYYEVVACPIDLLRIQQKLKAEEYSEVDHLAADVELMVSNAKSYYKKNTMEYKDACELWEIFLTTRNELEGKEPEPQEEESPLEELFAAVMTAVDQDGRDLNTMFRLLPSKTKYPEYYKVIQEPIDLRTIASRITQGHYNSLAELEKELLLMAKNAKAFNEPGSQIYKDAAMLRKIILAKKFDIEQRKTLGSKATERTKHKKSSSGTKWASVIANLSDKESSSSDREDSDPMPPEEGNSTLWQIYNAVKEYPGPNNTPLSDPFVRLPSKRFHADYYKEIRNPISLSKIMAKLTDKKYTSPMELVDDFNLLFDNAKKYNRPESKIFKDAVKLQKVMQSKASELINITFKDPDSEEEGFHNKPRKAKKSSLTSPTPTSTTPVAASAAAGSGATEGPPGATPTPATTTPTGGAKRGRKPLHLQDPLEVARKRKMRALYKSILEYTNEAGRNLVTMFMEKPLKKDYPDYYEVISNPIDMKSIEHTIKADKYPNFEALVSDFRLMFSNCQLYNEEGSEIYKDAVVLEKVLLDRVRELNLRPDVPRVGRPPLKKNLHKERAVKDELGRPCLMKTKLKNFYETIKEFTDNKGRKLSQIFVKLPSKTDYPEYYEVIKRPMNLEKIHQKLKAAQYETLEELLADFILMFDNACKYNEPDSQIYKDALTLQRVALQTKLELSEGSENGVPDIRALVQELLTNLFISTYNHQDEEGRCFSDSLVEFSESYECPDGTSKILTLDMIKRNLDKGRYRRLDRFQEDVFEVFELARKESRTDSQVFEDSIELQAHFIRTRDKLCCNGTSLHSPALNYSETDLQAAAEALRAEKLPKEPPMEVKSEKEEGGKRSDDQMAESLSSKGNTYRVGDFVYIEPREKGMEPHIIHIERLWKDKQGQEWIYGNWYYRPNETFHLATRKFLQKEVFPSDGHNSTPLSQVLGKCHVMMVKDYVKYRPEGFEDKDVYVCESRYSSRMRTFKKMKQSWHPPNVTVNLIPRPEPIQPIRVPSSFKDNSTPVEKSKTEFMEVEDNCTEPLEKPRPNVVSPNVTGGEEGAVYYQQLTIPAGTFKLGDCCYVRTEHGKTLIGRIDKMWVKGNNPYFHGPWFVTPQEVQHTPNRLFYKHEVFLSSIEDTNPLLSVISRCCVLDIKDYVLMRPTEIAEPDIYVCESRYLEAERQIRKLSKGLKKFTLPPEVTEDELYFFRKSITPQKQNVDKVALSGTAKASEMSPLSSRMDTDNEESSELPGETSTPNRKKQQQSSNSTASKRLITGYILFACEIRKQLLNSYPDRPFGEISRIIGNEWRNLSAAQKAEYEDKAQKQNEEISALGKEMPDMYPPSPATAAPTPADPANSVFECHWDQCDFQFEEHQDLADHLLGDSIGHLYQTYPNCRGEGEFQCLWTNCSRIKKQIPPFPNIQRLVRHLREVHFKSAMKSVAPENRSRNFVPSQRSVPSPASLAPGTPLSHPPQVPNGNFSGLTPMNLPPLPHHPPASPFPPPLPHHVPPPPTSYPPPPASLVGPPPMLVRPLEPLFVATPPRTQRILHSSTYIKYIEGLQSDNKHISNWDTQLKATKHTTTTSDPRRLPYHWLANGAGSHGNTINALWALRDFMLRDALNVSKIL